MKNNTPAAARFKWREILEAFGIDRLFLRNVHGPCPLCGGQDRFRFDDKNGEGTYYCSNCGPGDGFSMLTKYTGRSFADIAAEVDRIASSLNPQERQQRSTVSATERLKKIGSQLKRLTGDDPASRYLASRGLAGADTSCLRYHPGLPYFVEGKMTGRHPAMIAALRQPNGEVESFHATYLRADGSGKADVEAPKKLLGKRSETISGCAIQLSTSMAPTIGIAEGIENAMSVSLMDGINCWSAYSANALAYFDPPQWVERVVIYPDSDKNFIGQHSATTLGMRLAKIQPKNRSNGKAVEVILSPFLDMGVDYNDVLRGLK